MPLGTQQHAVAAISSGRPPRLVEIALTPDAIARAIAYAVEQPNDVDVNEVIVRPTISAL